ncbi:hypothetical protein L6R53_27265 [Myxococcota bacterium]|nr:hypothetical protein [Myxococcota bacterium]
MAAALCPACHRPAPAGRASCLYCGATLPPELAGRPRAPIAPAAVPDDLDQLVAAALKGGGAAQVQRLQEALRQARSSPVPPAPPTAGLALVPPPAPPLPDPLALAAALDLLVDDASAARRAWQAGDLRVAHARLRAVAGRVPGLLADLASPAPEGKAPDLDAGARADRSAPPPVELPPVRRAFLLVVEGPGDTERDRQLAQALEVDLATARQLAISRHPRVALRADEAPPLWERARAVRALGLRAAVTSPEELLAQPAAVLLVGVEPTGGDPFAGDWWVDPWPHWTAEAPPDPAALRAQARRAAPLSAILVVPGEVVSTRQAEDRDLGRATHRRHQGSHVVGETRLPVVDLHGPGGLVRLVPGWTDLSGLRGLIAEESLSATLNLRRLLEGMSRVRPDLKVEGSRSCGPSRDLPAPPEGAGRDRRVHTLSGWPTWEEHTRLCRVLHGLGEVQRGPEDEGGGWPG